MKHSYKPKSSRGGSNNRGRTSPSPIDNSYRSNSTRETTITTQQSSSNTAPNNNPNSIHNNDISTTTNTITKLPQLISITIYKQSPSQPAGLKLISNNSNNNSSNNNSNSSGVIISNISSTSPFHPSNFTNSTNGLLSQDELLTVNNHRVKHPSKAVTLIKQSVDKLNIVVGRGKRIDGMTYCLVRIDDNDNIDDVEDSRGNKESSSVGGESCSIASSSIKSKSKWQESKDSPSTIQSSTCHGLTFYQQNNLIYISNISSSSPFHKSSINVGDIILSINGQLVHTIHDVLTLLNSDSSLDGLDKGGGGGGGEDKNPYIKNDTKKEDRVVILLIYSMWKLRQRVLNDELHLVQDDNERVKCSGASCKSSNSRGSKNSKVSANNNTKGSSDKQVWQATYSYQEHDQSTPIQQSPPLVSLNNKVDNKKEEYIILRIPQTTVTFKLIFDNEGKCTCPNPYASVSSFNDNDKLSKEEGKLSKEEARMALDLLYQKYIVPVIDALNYETGCMLRLLRDLISGGSNTSTLPTTNSNKEPLHCSQEDLVNSAAKQTYEQQITLRKSFMNIQHTLPLTTSSACSTLDGTMSRRSDVSNSKGRHQQVLDLRKCSMEPLPPYQDLNNCKPATASSSEDKSTVHSKDSKVDQLNKVDNDFQSQLNKLHISKKPRPKSSSRRGGEKTSIDSSNQFYGKYADDLELNPYRKPRNKTPPKQRTPPRPSKKKLSPPRPTRKKDLMMSDAAIQPPRIQRRPSFVPVSDGKRLRSSIRLSGLSVLSSGEEEEDSSSTSTTRSDEQSNSSSNDHHVNDRQYHPQDRPVQATPKSKHQQHRPSELTSSTDMVVYSPELAETSREKQAAVDAAKSLPKPQLKRRLKMRNGDIRNNYKVSHRIIGTGAFGVVRSCMERSTREKYAVKSILKKGNVKNATLLKNEIALVQCVHHKNVVRVIDVIQDQEYIHIIMEELKGGDLFDRVVEGNTKLGEARASEILYSLLDALAYLHERNIVHRDLKAEHIMLSKDDINSEIKIIDFGLAIIHSQDVPKMKAFAGSAFTVAPEVIKRSYDKQCDLWSVGVITYFLLTARMPFNAKNDKEIFQKIIAGDYSYPAWTEKGLSYVAKDFIDSLLVVDPRKRLTAKQALSHVFIRKHNRTQDVNRTRQISQELALVPAVQSESTTSSRTPPRRRPAEDERRRERHPPQRAVKKYNSERNMTVSSRRRGERSPKPTQRRGYTPRGTL